LNFICLFSPVHMLPNGGALDGVRILKPETVRMMYTERAYRHLEAEPGMEWGLGVRVRQEPERAVSFAVKGTYGGIGIWDPGCMRRTYATHHSILEKPHSYVDVSGDENAHCC
jgi:hypothetical protein